MIVERDLMAFHARAKVPQVATRHGGREPSSVAERQ
jgi:hypothetical protein